MQLCVVCASATHTTLCCTLVPGFPALFARLMILSAALSCPDSQTMPVACCLLLLLPQRFAADFQRTCVSRLFFQRLSLPLAGPTSVFEMLRTCPDGSSPPPCKLRHLSPCLPSHHTRATGRILVIQSRGATHPKAGVKETLRGDCAWCARQMRNATAIPAPNYIEATWERSAMWVMQEGNAKVTCSISALPQHRIIHHKPRNPGITRQLS
jgi:hypothetical protein